MALLLDTHILIWLENSPSNISDEVRNRISSDPAVFISSASIWEMAIKFKTEKLSLKIPLQRFVNNVLADYQFKLLEVSLDHIYNTENLPLYHRDPFDRIIISQALFNNVQIVSSDKVFDAYGIKRIW